MGSSEPVVKGELWGITTDNELMHASVIVIAFRETDLDVTGKFGSAFSYNEGKECIPGCLLWQSEGHYQVVTHQNILIHSSGYTCVHRCTHV